MNLESILLWADREHEGRLPRQARAACAAATGATVASAPIEKPACGDFLSVLDGG